LVQFLEIVNSIKRKITHLIWQKKPIINIDVFSNPEKYIICLPIGEIIADIKVSPKAIELYKQKIKNKEKIHPIIVVKHPKYTVYAVLDGHHRYYAYLEMGKKEIECALAGDFSTVVFYLTEQGFFQPNLETKGEMRKPILQLHENLQDFLQNFLKDPEKQRNAKRESNILNDKYS
jgi:hypothetical protein